VTDGRRRPASTHRARGAAWLAWSLWAVCVALAALAVFLYGAQNRLLPGGSPYSLYLLNISVASLAISTVGTLVASRRPGNPIGWLFCASGFLHAIEAFAGEYGVYALIGPGSLPGGVMALWLASWAWILAGQLILFLFLLFPDGRLPSPRWRVVAWLSVIGILQETALYALEPAQLLETDLHGLPPVKNPFALEDAAHFLNMVGTVSSPLLGVLVLAPIVALFLRYRRARGEERQQIKWVAYAAALLTVAISVVSIWPALDGSIVGGVLFLIGFLAISIAIGIAILRHRLFDIDLIINRTLVYGVLTAALVAVYVGSVVLLQALLRALSGQESQLAVVASALAIAALFNPLRRRIQGFIDRRFYRKKYDAARTLSDFSAKLREETDLDSLSDDLVSVVEETMQPAHASLWLRPSEGSDPAGGR
jgi:hypothetical protein